MEKQTLQEKLEAIFQTVNPEEYPETMDILKGDAGSGFTELHGDPIDYANAFFDADAALPMPPAVAAFVKEVYEEETAKGSGEAANNLGALYYTGRIGEQDFGKAVELYSFAAQRGIWQAAENLGYCYYYGRNVEVDYEKAFRWFAQGAFTGHLTSLYKIGDMYRNGYFVEKNETEAFQIYHHCLEQMTQEENRMCGADVCMRLGDCWAEGIGTETDYEAALRMYQMAANLFRERIMEGDFMLKKNYRRSVDRENDMRGILEQRFPKWSGF